MSRIAVQVGRCRSVIPPGTPPQYDLDRIPVRGSRQAIVRRARPQVRAIDADPVLDARVHADLKAPPYNPSDRRPVASRSVRGDGGPHGGITGCRRSHGFARGHLPVDLRVADEDLVKHGIMWRSKRIQRKSRKRTVNATLVSWA